MGPGPEEGLAILGGSRPLPAAGERLLDLIRADGEQGSEAGVREAQQNPGAGGGLGKGGKAGWSPASSLPALFAASQELEARAGSTWTHTSLHCRNAGAGGVLAQAARVKYMRLGA